MPWPMGRKKTRSEIAKAANARWPKRVKRVQWHEAKKDPLNLALLDRNIKERKKSTTVDAEDAVKTKRKVMKENRLRGCQFDPAKAPPPIRFVPSNEMPPPADATDEIVAELKRLGCPMVRKAENGEQLSLDLEGKESCECESQDKQPEPPPTPQFAALSSKFIAELAFHLAQLMKKE